MSSGKTIKSFRTLNVGEETADKFVPDHIRGEVEQAGKADIDQAIAYYEQHLERSIDQAVAWYEQYHQHPSDQGDKETDR